MTYLFIYKKKLKRIYRDPTPILGLRTPTPSPKSAFSKKFAFEFAIHLPFASFLLLNILFFKLTHTLREVELR